ncbi:caspase-like isoform X2 [Toxorhynchites rutilus septentrionalis]|uniref:caspase-like isoform X2 n=1 Tax=Toxorhynchites rutilus septentrionalis TaxID=329112 RepID=UPI002478DD35|nr:caspase-like isoform X2 [Toxorhynchites rutilus septentrionalis]
MDNQADEQDFLGMGSNSSRSERIVSRPTLDEYYDTTYDRRGIALIFSHLNFSTMPSRNGTDKDRDDISSVLYDLDFDVRVFNDLSRKELLETLREVSREDHTKNDCLVVVVMSHGEQGVLYARDNKYSVDSLWRHFLGNACPSLIGKPKMFFIQACRGEKFDEGVVFSSPQMRNKPRDMVDSRSDQLVFSIPTMADLLLMYSTYDGYYSWRNPRQGSWFIQALQKELKENGKVKDLLTLLTGVSRRTAYEYQSCVPHDERMDCMKQIPCLVSMLTKTFYFTKKTKSRVVTTIE